jgi:hypothetical protein
MWVPDRFTFCWCSLNQIYWRIRKINITILDHQTITISSGRSRLHRYWTTIGIDNQYNGKIVDGAKKFWRSEIVVSSRSTDRPNAHLVAFSRDMHQQGFSEVHPISQKLTWKQSAGTRTDKCTNMSYGQVKCMPRGKSTKSTKILLKPSLESATIKLSRWSLKLTLNNNYQVKQHPQVNATYWWLPAPRYILQSLDSTSLLQFGKYNHLTETYVIGAYKWDYMELTNTIDSYSRCWLQKIPSRPIHERTLYHPDVSNKDLPQDDTSYKCSTGW